MQAVVGVMPTQVNADGSTATGNDPIGVLGNPGSGIGSREGGGGYARKK